MSADLAQMSSGFEGLIREFSGDEFLQSRLIELGFVRGERVSIIRKTVFGDFVVRVREADVALRKEEARCLLV